MNSLQFEAIGTHWNISYSDAHTSTTKHIENEITNRIEVFDKTYSRFRSDSLVTKMSKEKGDFLLPDDARELFAFYKKMYEVTDGLVTPLIGNVLADAGYDSKYSLVSRTLHQPLRLDEALFYKHPTLTIKKPVLLDFGAAGKGYLVDLIGKIFEKYTIKNFCVDGSGDLLYQSDKHEPLRIGLEHPENPKQAIGIATITNGSLCGSAGNRRKWGNFHHIINPKTLTSPKDILAVWVTAEKAMLADGLTTCLFFVEAAKLKKHFGFEYALLKSDYTIETSQDFPGEFFYNE